MSALRTAGKVLVVLVGAGAVASAASSAVGGTTTLTTFEGGQRQTVVRETSTQERVEGLVFSGLVVLGCLWGWTALGKKG